jgi:acyl carrier protein
VTKTEVFEVLKKNLLRQLEDQLKTTEIDPAKSMVDYGANSLDLVEIVSKTMRELRIKVPRDELAVIKNIDGLVAKMAEYKNAAVAKG